jgi:hypothetical protein
MAVDVSEIVIRAKPDVDEAVDGLDQMEGKVEESADEMAEQSEEMSGLAESFSGAMSVAVAGLAIGAAGLLSTIPVVGEAMTGLFAIVGALSFQMDSVLRPVLSPLTDLFFGIADAIFELNGPMGTLVGFTATLGALLGTLFGILVPLVGTTTAWAVTFGKVVTAAKLLVGAITAVVGAIGLLPALIIGGVAVALGLLAWHFRDEIASAVFAAIDAIQGFVSQIGPAVQSVLQIVRDKFTGLISDARSWGRSVIRRFINGLKSRVANLQNIIGQTEIAAGVSVNDITGAAGDISGAASGAVNEGRDFIGSVAGGATKVFLDGQRVDNQTGRFRKESLTRRGG